MRYGGLISIILIFIATQLEEGTKRTVLAAIGFMSLGLNIVQSLGAVLKLNIVQSIKNVV